MPVGAEIYLQVPDSASYEDIQKWKVKFVTDFDFYEGVDEDFVDRYVFNVAEWGLPDIPHHGTHMSAWEVFPTSTFLEIHTMLAYYFPGYERGGLEELIRIGEWIEENVSEGVVWYGCDGGGTPMPFPESVREIFQEYFQKVGYEPYGARRRGEEARWESIQAEYINKITKQQAQSLAELKNRYGVQ